MDYETFGEHQWAETGIFDFMRALPRMVFAKTNFEFLTPSEASQKHQPVALLHVPHPISWADEERDLTAWLGNELQDSAFNELYSLADMVEKVNDPILNAIGFTYKPATTSTTCVPNGSAMAMFINTSIPTIHPTRLS